MRFVKQTFPYFSERLMRALGIQGDMPGDLAGHTQPVIISADMTDIQYNWARRGRSWGSSDNTGAAGAQSAGFLFTTRGGVFGAKVIARIRRIAFWSNGATPCLVAWRTSQLITPVFSASDILQPTALDNRLYGGAAAVTGVSAFVLQSGVWATLAPIDGADGWIRAPSPVISGGVGNNVAWFDPMITLSADQGGSLQIAAQTQGFSIGCSILWEERDASDQELQQ